MGKNRHIGAVLAFATLVIGPLAHAQAPRRVSDQQVEATLKQVKDGLDRFVDTMDPQMRTAVLRNERGQVDVKAFLGDLRKSADAMKDRFDPPRYSANTEVISFLTEARRLDAGLARRPGISGADPSWELVKPALASLGGAYGIDWTAEPGAWTAVRISDDELKSALGGMEKKSDGLRKELEKSLKKDKSLNATARTSVLAPAVDLSETAKQANAAFSKGTDVAPLVTKLIASAGQVGTTLTERKPVGPAASLWSGLQGDLDKVAKGYGVALKN